MEVSFVENFLGNSSDTYFTEKYVREMSAPGAGIFENLEDMIDEQIDGISRDVNKLRTMARTLERYKASQLDKYYRPNGKGMERAKESFYKR